MYIVTGGAGFIGSNIVAALEERGRVPIVVSDWLDIEDPSCDKARNLEKRRLTTAIPPEDLAAFLDDNKGKVEAIIHMGAISATTATDVDEIFENNFVLSLDLWRWCAENGARFLYASSAATYGGGEQGFEDDPSIPALAGLRPLNAYGWSKHLFDRRVMRMVEEGAARPPQWAGFKFFNVFGPNEYHKGGMKSVVAHVFPAILAGEPAVLFKSHNPDYPDGGQTRDFIWVGDCVRVVMWFLDNPSVSGLYNVGTGKGRTFADLARAVFRALGREPRITYVPTPRAIRDKYQYFTEAGMERLRAAGYSSPFTSLEDGVAEYVRGYLNSNDPYI